MDFPIYIDTIRMELPIVYFNGSQVDITKSWCVFVPEDCFSLSKQCRPWWNAALCCISSWSTLFAKVPVLGFPVYKGLNNVHQKLMNYFLSFTTMPLKHWVQHCTPLQRHPGSHPIPPIAQGADRNHHLNIQLPGILLTSPNNTLWSKHQDLHLKGPRAG